MRLLSVMGDAKWRMESPDSSSWLLAPPDHVEWFIRLDAALHAWAVQNQAPRTRLLPLQLLLLSAGLHSCLCVQRFAPAALAAGQACFDRLHLACLGLPGLPREPVILPPGQAAGATSHFYWQFEIGRRWIALMQQQAAAASPAVRDAAATALALAEIRQLFEQLRSAARQMPFHLYDDFFVRSSQHDEAWLCKALRQRGLSAN